MPSKAEWARQFLNQLKNFLKNIKTSEEGIKEITIKIRDSIVPNKTPTGILGSQAIGALAYAAWSVGLSFIVLGILKATMGLRVSKEVEIEGLDISEHGSIAYPGKRQRDFEEE